MIHFRTGIAVLLSAFVLQAGATESQALVGSADITNNAVTTPKIKNLAVTNAKIGNLAVTAAKIANLAVTATKIANGAVTPRKISSNRNVIIVAPAGGDFTDPVDALASITNASESNPYLVRLMPGRYDVGDRSVIMKPFVDLEGSGEMVTTVQGTVSTPFDATNDQDARPLYGVITLADESEVRFLSVGNTGAAGGSKCVAALLARDSDATISHVRAYAVGTNCNVGISVNITDPASDGVALLRDVQAYAAGGVTSIGIGVRGVVAEMTAAMLNCVAQASGASSNNFGLTVNNAAPIVQGGVLMAEGGTLTLALRGSYGLPTLQGVLAMGPLSFYGNVGVAVLNQCSTGAVFVNNAFVDIFNSSLGGAVTLSDDGTTPTTPTARCAGAVRTDTLATLNADCGTP